MLEILFFFLMM